MGHCVLVAIDGYSAGHSSLACLKRLPIDELKFGRSFVRDLVSLGVDVTIVASMIRPGHCLEPPRTYRSGQVPLEKSCA